MRYMVCINNDERLDSGDEDTFSDVLGEVSELLRSGYFAVEYMDEVGDNE